MFEFIKVKCIISFYILSSPRGKAAGGTKKVNNILILVHTHFLLLGFFKQLWLSVAHKNITQPLTNGNISVKKKKTLHISLH